MKKVIVRNQAEFDACIKDGNIAIVLKHSNNQKFEGGRQLEVVKEPLPKES